MINPGAVHGKRDDGFAGPCSWFVLRRVCVHETSATAVLCSWGTALVEQGRRSNDDAAARAYSPLS